MESNVIRTFILGLLAVCLLTLLGIYYVWQHHRLVSIGGDLSRVSQELKAQHTENELLEAEYRTLRSAASASNEVLTALQLKRPSSVDTIYMEGVGARPLKGRTQ
jgi:hypothetical protein